MSFVATNNATRLERANIMAIIQTVDFSDFRQAFYAYNRQYNFSSAAQQELFEMLEDLSEQTGEDWELDVIAICCDFQEWNVEDFVREYRVEVGDEDCSKEWAEAVESYLQDNAGWFVFLDDETVLFQVF